MNKINLPQAAKLTSPNPVSLVCTQKPVDENTTRKLGQRDCRKKYDGYAGWYAAFESRKDSLQKERKRKDPV